MAQSQKLERRCYLHIGPPKTGTSAIQATLRKGSDKLKKLGYYYPDHEGNHISMVSPFLKNPEKLYRNKTAGGANSPHNTDALQAFETGMAHSGCAAAILSSEHFSIMSPTEISALAGWLGDRFDDVRVIFYARAPAMILSSRIQQSVKLGRQSLDEALKSPPSFQYMQVIEAWADVFGREAMMVLAYPGDPPDRQDIVEDFLKAIGAWDEAVKFEAIPSNQSLSGAAVLIADALNRVAPRGDEKRALQKYLKRIKGPKYIPDPTLIERSVGGMKADLTYLEKEWGITFPETPPEKPENMFNQDVIDSVAELLNDLAYGALQAGVNIRARPSQKSASAAKTKKKFR